MGKNRGPYKADFPVGSRVRVANRAFLEEFRNMWPYHHKLEVGQFAYADTLAVVEKLVHYHGGDELYWLSGVPGVWHEQCLRLETTNVADTETPDS